MGVQRWASTCTLELGMSRCVQFCLVFSTPHVTRQANVGATPHHAHPAVITCVYTWVPSGVAYFCVLGNVWHPMVYRRSTKPKPLCTTWRHEGCDFGDDHCGLLVSPYTMQACAKCQAGIPRLGPKKRPILATCGATKYGQKGPSGSANSGLPS